MKDNIFTDREIQIMRLTIAETKDFVITKQLGITQYTLNEHWRHIRQKTGKTTKLGAVLYAYAMNYVSF